MSDDFESTSSVDAVAKLATLAAGGGKVIIAPGRKPFILAANADGHLQPVYVEEVTPPSYIDARPVFIDPSSLIAYVNRFKDHNSLLFAEPLKGTIRAILDYHEPVASMAPVIAARAAHQPSFAATFSDQWVAWTAKNTKPMDQEAFASHIEDNLMDLARPNGADMLEIASSISATSGATFKSGRRSENGSVVFEYSEQVEGKAAVKGQPLEVPRTFDLAIPVYAGTEPITVPCRLKYRINGGSLVLWYEIIRPTDILRASFQSIMDMVGAQTGIMALIGTWEGHVAR